MKTSVQTANATHSHARPKLAIARMPLASAAAMLETAYMPQGKTVDQRRVS